MASSKIRCAIYTRKSTEEGLDQEFNSLDAQREACTAYIASQRHEGWKAIHVRYDDGGVSGGTLDRPALQRLRADIRLGRIDMVVVYKIDRLTRSLADFAKLVEELDNANCSFVSVTQAFNTWSSMGRLTLNVLLSFAQFEREVTAERIRDKIAASKKKGMWMGGVPPLGYDPHPDPSRRELVINRNEAKTVRQLFEFYTERKCLAEVTKAAEDHGLRSKRHRFSTGRQQGGNRITRGQIHKILTNPIYAVLIRHKDKTYPGLHSPIITKTLWENVQSLLQAASARRRGGHVGKPTESAAMLKGKVRDETGDLLTPSHTRRGTKICRYYVSNRLISRGRDPSGWRLPARSLEATVAGLVASHFETCAKEHRVLSVDDARLSQNASAAVRNLAEKISANDTSLAASLIISAQLATSKISIKLDGTAVACAVGLGNDCLATDLLQFDAEFYCRRRGVELKIVAGELVRGSDATLLSGLRRAHLWSEQLKSGVPLKDISKEANVSERYAARIIPLACLSPRIQTAIVKGLQPPELTLRRLVKSNLPMDWNEQEILLGFNN